VSETRGTETIIKQTKKKYSWFYSYFQGIFTIITKITNSHAHKQDTFIAQSHKKETFYAQSQLKETSTI